MAGRKRPHPAAELANCSRNDPEPAAARSANDRPRRNGWPRDAGDSSPSRCEEGVSLGQISMAEFARMSSSRQLSLWAILQAQISSQKELASRRARRPRKALPLSPEE